MNCRIGITTDPDRRHQEWRQKVTVTNFVVLERHTTRAAAQEAETRLALKLGCAAHPGGESPDQPNAIWHVYQVNYRCDSTRLEPQTFGGRQMANEPDFRRNFRQDLHKINRELIAIHDEVREPEKCQAGCCYICQILSCMELLCRHTVTEPWNNGYYKKKILQNPFYYAIGVGAGVRLAFIARHIDWRKDDKLKRTLVDCETLNPLGPVLPDTPNLDTLHEYFFEALLKQVKCEDIHRPPQGNDRVIDFRFTADSHRFAAECKRMKTEAALRNAPEKARAQLDKDPTVRDRTAHRLMILDYTHYITGCLFEMYEGSFPKGNVMRIVWGELDKAHAKLHLNMHEKYARSKDSGVFCNTILMADVSWLSENLAHETYPVMCLIEDGLEQSEQAINCLYDRIRRYAGYTEQPEEAPSA